MRPLLIAHRGGARGRAKLENRLSTFARALALGVDALECDVQLSADNEVVVIHDATLDRTTAGHGHVGAFTAKELAALGVPTLRDLCRLVRGKARLLIEIKSASPYRVMDVLAGEKMEREVLVISFHPEYLRPIARLRPDIELGLLLYQFGGDVPTLARYIKMGRELRATTLGPNLRLCTRRLVAAVHAAGMRVFTWTANSKLLHRVLIRVGVDGIVTDYPERLKELL
ncbi:MAG: glycerophosphodiester phosphodiesterase [Verrucomicrobia bacterium]|nr:glycerophosphodiester phosphodiesterase [Verrucomicrobiota bacterium]